MSSYIKLAREMLETAKLVMALDETAGIQTDINTFTNIVQPKKRPTQTQFKNLKKVFTSDDEEEVVEQEDNLENASMDELADELLKVADELIGDGE